MSKLKYVILPVLLISAFAVNALALRFNGNIVSLGQGYQDYYGEDHFILANGLRFHLTDFRIAPLSFHGYFQYYGDTQDDYTANGKFRLYSGYLQYTSKNCPISFRGGRMFLFRGVAVGVLDGGEIAFKANHQVTITAFGGMQGPLSREWELEKPAEATMFGGEIRFIPFALRKYRTTIAVSYTHQKRDGELMRHLAGIAFNFKLNRRWSSLNVVHLNLVSSSLRKAITRWQYHSHKFRCALETAAIQPYFSASSYFNDFKQVGTIFRFKNTTEYHYIAQKWGGGLSAMFFTTGEYGVRIGPYFIFPYGRIGCHFSQGNQPNNNILWGHLRWSPEDFIEIYAYATAMEYEWEEMEIDTQETSMLNLGCRFRPPLVKGMAVGLEWQNYKTPEVDYDQRIIFNFHYNFNMGDANE